ncbi:MAG: alpha/beta hydrolase [Burkholderiales bacterium]|nr:alpha/beta hydrolase [Burkholderiales bacterium]
MQSSAPDKRDEASAFPDGAYRPRRNARLLHANIRGLDHAVREWGDPALPPVLLLHGWMDASSSWQFLADALPDSVFSRARVVAPDWRGFGDSAWPRDGYWFADYHADLDALLDWLGPTRPVTLIGHSMGGNIACIYAGLRPARVGKLVSLEGFGMPDSPADAAPARLRQWLDHLKAEVASPAGPRPYPDIAALADRLRRANPRLTVERSLYLAAMQSRLTESGRVLKHDPRHKAPGALPYRLADAMAAWRCVTAPTLWVQGDQSDLLTRFHGTDDSDLAQRAACFANIRRQTLADAGHMLQHDQPEVLAARLAEFLAD